MKTATAPLPPLRSVKVLDQLRERIRYLHYSLPTEQAYVHWVRAFIRFHGVRHPATLGSSEVEAFLSWLANERKVSVSIARQVRSGDPENKEAQAARKYWKSLFGTAFKRDIAHEGINNLLNYGYIVLRALVSRAICASGLHPTLGVFHSHRANAFALADDLMEPYRPFVDRMVFHLLT